MKKQLCGLLVGTVLLASGLSAYAENVTYTTSTKYAVGKAGKIEVTTTVNGAAAGAQLTYLAYNGEAVSKETIVYVDQIEAKDSETPTFKYYTDSKNVRATVKFGSDMTGQTVQQADIPGYKITISAGEGGTVDTASAPGNVIGVPEENGTSLKFFPVKADSGYVVDTITFTGTGSAPQTISADEFMVGTDGIYVGTEITSDGTLALTFKERETENYSISAVRGVFRAGTEAGATAASKELTVLASANCPDSAEYGIAISKNSDMTGAEYYQALGKGADGQFMVKLYSEDGEGFDASATYYAQGYYGAEGSETLTGTPITITYTGGAQE